MSTRLFGPFMDEVRATTTMRQFVLGELAASARRWHGLRHHALMLRAIDRSIHRGSDRRRLIQAVLFHDIVYDATRPDNEEASAMVARQWVPAEDADAVAELILATKHHDLATDPVTRTLLEADLGVLWTPVPRLYAFYAAGIRVEYAHVPDDAYRVGRAGVMARLRDGLLPHLDPARAALLVRNVDGEIAALA